MAGAGRMEMRTFISAGIFGRSIRFGMEVLVVGFWGEEFVQMLEEPLFWIVVGVLSIVIFVPLNNWWNDLDSPAEELPQ